MIREERAKMPRHRLSRHQERDKGKENKKETKEMERTWAVIFTSIFIYYYYALVSLLSYLLSYSIPFQCKNTQKLAAGVPRRRKERDKGY